MGNNLSLDYSAITLFYYLAIVLFVGIVAGGFPVLILTKFDPVEVLKGRLGIGGPNLFSRALVAIQFGCSIFLIVSVGVMANQVSFLRTKELGFKSDNVVVIPTSNRPSGDDIKNTQRTRLLKVLQNELTQYENIINVAGSSWSLSGSGRHGRSHIQFEETKFEAFHFKIDYNYLETFGMELIDGRNVSQDTIADSEGSVIVNESFAKEIGSSYGIGKKIRFGEGNIQNPTIIGIVKDFHFQPLYQEIEPLILHLAPWQINYIFIKIKSDDIPGTLSLIKTKWNEKVRSLGTKIEPNLTLEYSFLEDNLDQHYKSEEQWTKIIGYSSGVSILIACMGLLGLTTLAITRRTKEIGIRKVLGASSFGIVYLLSKEQLRIVIVATIITWPLAYLTLIHWLQNFVYRVDLDMWPFIVGGGITLMISLIPVSYQAIKTAVENPIKALRYE